MSTSQSIPGKYPRSALILDRSPPALVAIISAVNTPLSMFELPVLLVHGRKVSGAYYTIGDEAVVPSICDSCMNSRRIVEGQSRTSGDCILRDSGLGSSSEAMIQESTVLVDGAT